MRKYSFTVVQIRILKRLINITYVNSAVKRIFASILALSVVLLSSFAFSPMFEENNPPKVGLHKVVIDAGHGGKDPGCVGSNAKEKDIALGIALKLGEKITKHYKDVDVVYTRDDDTFVELYERAIIANNKKADLFICIHVNASPSSEPKGIETYVMGLHKSKANLNVAKRENASILMEDNYKTHYEGFDPNSDESYIALTLRQNVFLEQSLSFASMIQDQVKTIGRNDRGIRQAGFLVLWRTAMPSVLIETGFISNNEEESFLMNEKHQDEIAEGIYKAFAKYKSEVDGNFQLTENNKHNTIKKDITINKDEVVLKVQITSSINAIPLKPEYFKGFEEVDEYQSNGMYKYTIGSEKSMNEAARLQSIAREKGFKDAFVVAFKGNERIPLDKGLKELK